jgi:hypothetical protein
MLRIYLHYLMKGNPIAVGITIVGALAISVGPFYEGLAKRDPMAIGMVVMILLGILFLLAIAIIDRRNDPERKRQRPTQQATRRR